MATHQWLDRLARSYDYQSHDAEIIAEKSFVFSGSAVHALTAAAGELANRSTLHHAAGLAAVLYRSESGASSIIEGLDVRPRRILEAEFADADEVDDPIARRIVANLRGLEDALETARPIAGSDLLRWHAILMKGDPHARPEHVGAWRKEQNWIGGDALGPRGASFIPPHPNELPPLLDDLVAFTLRDDLSPITLGLLAHAQFEVLHPFADGNGRVGRMLLQHELARGMSAAEPIPVSVIWSRDKDRYIDALRSLQDGDLDSWVEFGATSLLLAGDWLRETARAVDQLIQRLADRAAARAGSAAAKIVRDLPRFPIVDAPGVADRYGISKQAAHRALARLEQQGIIRDQAFARGTTKRGRPRRVFASPDLIELLDTLG